MSKIGKAGPNNAAILDTEKSLIEKDDSKILVLDENLASKLKFIKEGEFVEKKGATALKLVGDIVPIDKVEVVKRVKENLIKEYPLTAKEIIQEIKKRIPDIKEGEIYSAIKDNKIKDDIEYSAYNFRSKKHEDDFQKNGKLPSGTPSIYKEKCIDYLTQIIKNRK